MGHVTSREITPNQEGAQGGLINRHQSCSQLRRHAHPPHPIRFHRLASLVSELVSQVHPAF